jgi:hypothetical protein
MLRTRASPETYDLLVLQRGWATAQYADRLADTLAANLLRAGTAGHDKAITREPVNSARQTHTDPRVLSVTRGRLAPR